MSTPEQRNQIMNQITKEFVDEPLAISFAKPFQSDDKKTMSDYANRIKHPMDLQTVRKNIKDKKYSGYQAWIDDMNLIWDNAVEFNTADTIIGGIAVYLKKKFQKRILALDVSNLRNYEAQLLKLTKDIQAIIADPPASFGVQPKKDWCQDADPFTVSRVREIMNGVEKLDKEGKTGDVLNTIAENEPGFKGGPDSVIDFGVLGRRTLLALEELVKKAAN